MGGAGGSTRRLDVAIAGMGIGGLTLAVLLREAGHGVVLYDRMERPGPVGSGFILQPTGLAVLDGIGAGDDARDLGAPIARMFGRTCPSNRVVLDVEYPDGRPGYGIQRSALFALLHRRAIDSGADVEHARHVSAVSTGPRRYLGFADGRRSVRFDLIIDALGSRSPLLEKCGRDLAYGALWTTVPWNPGCGLARDALEQRYRRARQMVGILPVGRSAIGSPDMATFFWSIRRDAHETWRAKGHDAWREDIGRLWPEIGPIAATLGEPSRALYRHHTDRSPVEEGLARIGDAFHSASPQLGQGANMAMLDALALATSLRTEADIGAALARYVRRRRGHIRTYQVLSRLFTPFYQSDGFMLPFVRDRVAAPLSRNPVARRILTGMVSGTIGDPVAHATAE